jgi:hypothetical protein
MSLAGIPPPPSEGDGGGAGVTAYQSTYAPMNMPYL